MAIDLATWQWPQWSIAVSYGLSLLIIAAVNGKPKTGEYNFALSFMSMLVYAVVLGFGGFWS